MAIEDREVLFTERVLNAAAERYDAVKDQLASQGFCAEHVGEAMLVTLGWDVQHVKDYAVQVTAALADGLNLDLGERAQQAMGAAIIDSLVFGAVCADITYERKMGL
jgi:hypothetical protein